MATPIMLSASVQPVVSLSAHLTIPTQATHDYYNGEYIVTPNATTQTVPTAQKFLSENITVSPVFYIKTQPTTYIGQEDDIVDFTVTVEGEELSYQWQYKSVDATTWEDSTQESAQTNELSIQLLSERDGESYRCKITDVLNRVLYSNEVKTIIADDTSIPHVDEIVGSFSLSSDSYIDSNSTGGVISSRVTGLPDGEQFAISNGDLMTITDIVDNEIDGTSYANANDVRQGKYYLDNMLTRRVGAADFSGSSTGGIDTSDATATASDIVSAKTAYVNNVKITGNVREIKPSQTFSQVFDSIQKNGSFVYISGKSQTDALVRTNANIGGLFLASIFGDATAEDVSNGKIFTSQNGIAIVGTKQDAKRLADDEEIYSKFPDVEDASFDSYSTGMYVRTRITGLPDGEQRIVQNGDPIYIDAIYDREHSYTEYASDKDVRQGLLYRDKLLNLRTGTAVDTQANGTFTINSNVNSYSISTNLSTIHGFHVSIKETSSTAKTNTWDFNGTSGFVIAKTQYTYTAPAISASYYSISGGILTIKQYSSSSPIVAGEYIYTIW